LTIYHLLAQARRTIVVAVPDALLFGAMDAELRRELVQSGRLDLVLSLAAGILPTTNASFSILRLSPDGGSGGGRVRFINGQSDNLTGRTFNPRSRPQLINLETLLALSHSEEESSVCSSSSIDEILSNDAQLQTSQYILSEQQKRLRQDLQQKETVELGVLARIIQPAFRRIAADMPEEHITMIREVALSDIPEYGYIQKASRENPIDTRSKKNLNLNTLQPGDIIVTTKGTVGKVGMLPENSARLDEKPWAVGQSAVALRVHSDAPIDSKTLFMLLRSPLGQEILKQHITGATMPLISTSQLRRVRLPIPSAHEQKQALAALEQEEALQREIEQLRQRQMQAAEQLWRID
jgi:type I restriction enzyme M protein